MKEQAAIPTFDNIKMLRAMVGIGIICAVLIVFTYEATLPRIEKLKAEALQEAIFEVIPGISEIKAFSYEDNTFSIADENSQNIIYAGYDDQGSFKGVAISANGIGYAGNISILYGYNPNNQQVIGFYVLESKETPGLGDKIEKDTKFLDNFSALDLTLDETNQELKNKVTTVKSGTKVNGWEIDGITGATISSRAIGVIMDESASVWAPIIYQNQEVFKKAAMAKASN